MSIQQSANQVRVLQQRKINFDVTRDEYIALKMHSIQHRTSMSAVLRGFIAILNAPGASAGGDIKRSASLGELKAAMDRALIDGNEEEFEEAQTAYLNARKDAAKQPLPDVQSKENIDRVIAEKSESKESSAIDVEWEKKISRYLAWRPESQADIPITTSEILENALRADAKRFAHAKAAKLTSSIMRKVGYEQIYRRWGRLTCLQWVRAE